jgi:hypothetical protein
MLLRVTDSIGCLLGCGLADSIRILNAGENEKPPAAFAGGGLGAAKLLCDSSGVPSRIRIGSHNSHGGNRRTAAWDRQEVRIGAEIEHDTDRSKPEWQGARQIISESKVVGNSTGMNAALITYGDHVVCNLVTFERRMRYVNVILDELLGDWIYM